ncbi:MAG: hypothetical protein JOZ10_05460 [Acidobacteria bacterium]|nr:hypothetical protein [Acidobacteriota bacterium]MBV9147143.1 hypothetical protein [Acidobacteriota bacterium]MBV9437833.1 hypothetical protein [Acidobacteriota bacterium]
MRSLFVLAAIAAATLFSSCSYSSMSGNTSIAPTVTGAWTLAFTPTGNSEVTTLHVNFTQNGSSLAGTVTSVSNPDTVCFGAINSQSTFTITGQAIAQSQSNSNLNISVGFTSGSTNGTLMGTGTLTYLGTMGNGNFSFTTGSSGCTSGTFTITQG